MKRRYHYGKISLASSHLSGQRPVKRRMPKKLKKRYVNGLKSTNGLTKIILRVYGAPSPMSAWDRTNSLHWQSATVFTARQRLIFLTTTLWSKQKKSSKPFKRKKKKRKNDFARFVVVSFTGLTRVCSFSAIVANRLRLRYSMRFPDWEQRLLRLEHAALELLRIN